MLLIQLFVDNLTNAFIHFLLHPFLYLHISSDYVLERQSDTHKEMKRQRSFICWLIPRWLQWLGLGWSQEPGTLSGTPISVAGSCMLGPSSASSVSAGSLFISGPIHTYPCFDRDAVIMGRGLTCCAVLSWPLPLHTTSIFQRKL